MGIGYKTAKELYLETQMQITRSSDAWTSFLNSSTWMFEYTFGEQLLIYAQRPDARACATMKKWNETFNRWVKKGSTAITVLKYLDGKSMLNSIFDISDTYPRFKKPYNLWELNKEADAEEYIEALESKYGELKSKNTLPNAIISAVQNLTEDSLKSYLDEAIKYTDMDEASFRKLFSEIVEVSVMYSALTRCGFDAKDYIDKSNFDDITFFNSPEMIAILGVTCQELTRDILRETRTFVNNKSYTFDNQINKVYFDDKENERRDLDDKLSRNRRLQNTRYKIGGQSRENSGEIFKSEGEILEELQSGTIRALEDDRRIDTTLERDSNDLQSTRRTDDERDDGKRKYNRGIKGNEPRKVVSTNEQLETYNRGNNNERVHLYLDDLLSESEQINFIDNLVFKIDEEESIISEEELIEDNDSKGIEQIVTENSTDTKSRKDKLQSFFIPQNSSSEDKLQFEITDENLGVGGLKEKFRFNSEAIKILKQCEEENRLATKEEQEILSRYVGWGGLQDAFNEKKVEWKNEYEELKELLTEEEYNKAKASTLTAFYTPPIVISSIYEALENMGFKNGNILEPSCGIGNFIGRLPKSMQDSNVYGIELDSITGRIAKQLYQKSNIAIQGFEDTDLPDNAFDIAIGNVPFGDFKVTDKRYDKHNFLIHDYFFAKSIDKVRAGGIIAFVTSKGTLDKENPSFRKYIAQRADLIGAIRLPDNTFKSNAGTQTTTDIIFLQKKEHPIETEQEWIHLGIDENGIKMNQYFIDNPQMVLGNMEMTSTQYGGLESTCKPFANSNLKELLKNAITNLKGEILNLEIDEFIDEIDDSIPADINVRNYSYTSKNNKIYYRENSRMYPQDLSETSINRIKGLIDIRDCTRNLIELQNTNALDNEIKNEQERLNSLYDNFVKEYGRISDRANKKAFEEDSSYYLLCSLEILDENGNFKNKADMFTKRTIKTDKEVQNVVTANDALIVCISEKAKVDLDYMSSLIGEPKEKIVEELQGLIFKLPNTDNYVTSDEYLSGNIREKLREAEQAFELDKSLDINIERLKNALPKDLTIGEISAKLGSTWIPAEIMEQFMYELLGTPWDLKRHIRMNYSEHNATWSILGKSKNRGNVKVYSTYGTSRVNGYKVLEATLNLKTIKVYDTIVNAEGKQERILNKKETAIAQAKQELIKEEFDLWIWKDIDRRNKLVKLYNERFNSIKPREYNGEHIKFVGMNPEITLREHQVNAIAHILYGNNTLLAHVVGAGKTFEMVAAAMESKRLGLSNKALFVVPNHIIEQFASEFLQLYPSANILVATQKDFSTNYRKRFCGKIATGEYDAVIIGHSQFESATRC